MNTTILVIQRQGVLDDLGVILETHPENATALALDICRRYVLRLNEGELDRLRTEMAQRKTSPPGGETRRAAEKRQ